MNQLLKGLILLPVVAALVACSADEGVLTAPEPDADADGDRIDLIVEGIVVHWAWSWGSALR